MLAAGPVTGKRTVTWKRALDERLWRAVGGSGRAVNPGAYLGSCLSDAARSELGARSCSWCSVRSLPVSALPRQP